MYRCNFCGRVFKQRTPHHCKGGFRKRKLAWTLVPEEIKFGTECDNISGFLYYTTSCPHGTDYKVGSPQCDHCSYQAGRSEGIVKCTCDMGTDVIIPRSKSGQYTKFPVKDYIGLLQLRDYSNKSWIPDWTNPEEIKYWIGTDSGNLVTGSGTTESRVLSFSSEVIRDHFLNQHRSLIERLKYFI